MADGSDAAWGRYVRECFVARQTPVAEPPPPPPGSADNPDEPSWASPARGDTAIKRPPPLNVLKDTYDHSCY